MSDTLASALVAAQGEMPAVTPDSTNPHFGSKFVSLGKLLASVRPVLNKHGIAVLQMPAKDDDGSPVLVTRLLHTSGEATESTMALILTKNDPQGQGSALTYAKRYALAAVLAIADQEDDDGNQGSAPPAESGPTEKQKDFLDKLLGKSYADTDASLIRGYVSTLGGAAVSKAITGLKEDDENLKASLLNAAREWDTRNSDIPGDAPSDDDNLEDVPFD